MSDHEADKVLVERVQQGDRDAFGFLVDKYQRKLLRLASRFVSDPVEAEDVVQEAFIKAYRALPNFRGDSAFYTWLYRITINAAKSWLQVRGRSPSITTEHEHESDDEISEDARLQHNDSPERLLMSREIADTVNRALEKLPEDLRVALVMCEIDGFSYEEISAAMDCPIGTVRSRIFRAREAIAEKLRPLLDVANDRRW